MDGRRRKDGKRKYDEEIGEENGMVERVEGVSRSEQASKH